MAADKVLVGWLGKTKHLVLAFFHRRKEHVQMVMPNREGRPLYSIEARTGLGVDLGDCQGYVKNSPISADRSFNHSFNAAGALRFSGGPPIISRHLSSIVILSVIDCFPHNVRNSFSSAFHLCSSVPIHCAAQSAH